MKFQQLVIVTISSLMALFFLAVSTKKEKVFSTQKHSSPTLSEEELLRMEERVALQKDTNINIKPCQQ